MRKILKFILWVVTALILAALIAWGSGFIKTGVTTSQIINVESIIKEAQELVSYQYIYTDAKPYKKVGLQIGSWDVPFTTDEEIVTFSGIVSVGIKDTSQVKIDRDDTNKTITITLPKLEILHHELEVSEYFEVSNSIFTSTNNEEWENFRKELKTKEEEQINQNEEFWELAKDHAGMAITQLLKAALPDYEIVVK